MSRLLVRSMTPIFKNRNVTKIGKRNFASHGEKVSRGTVSSFCPLIVSCHFSQYCICICLYSQC